MVRVISAIVLGLAVLAVVWFLPSWGVSALVLIAALLGLFEFSRMFLADGVERRATVIAGLAVAIAMVLFRPDALPVLLILALALFVLSLIFMRRAEQLEGSAGRLACAMLGVVYLGVCFPFWYWIEGFEMGRAVLLLAIVPACLCDTFALAAGKAFGRHRMAPRVSPNKTIEGFFGALVGSFAGVFLMRWILMPSLTIQHAALLAIVIWIVSPFGDLVESYFKRSSGVKDSGAIIPGHGGVLDRLDALVFTGPAVYAYVKYVI